MSDNWEIPLSMPGRLLILSRPRGDEWLSKDVQAWKSIGIDEVVSLLELDEVNDLDLMQEADAVRNSGMQFVAYPIADRGVPASAVSFGNLVQSLSKEISSGKTIGIHCRQGIGRSAIVAAAILIANGTEPHVALETISQSRGCAVPETEQQRQWLVDQLNRFREIRVRSLAV